MIICIFSKNYEKCHFLFLTEKGILTCRMTAEGYDFIQKREACEVQ